jgi:NAD(P)H-dependent FMN reductase
MKPLKIQIILGSTRQNRFSEKAASYIYQEIKKKKDVVVELVDLRDYPLPYYDEPVAPALLDVMNHHYTNEVVNKWTKKVGEADGYIIVTAEYNHGYPGVLKNALDYVFKEWNRKAVGFVGYGNAGGARAIEQLRQVVIELQMVPIRSAVHIPSNVYLALRNEKMPVNLELFQPLRTPVDRIEMFLEDLMWTTKALREAREKEEKNNENASQ